MPMCASVYMCHVVTCWERVDLLALVCVVLHVSSSLSLGILGQVWYLIVSIPDLCTLTYFKNYVQHIVKSNTLVTHYVVLSLSLNNEV